MRSMSSRLSVCGTDSHSTCQIKLTDGKDYSALISNQGRIAYRRLIVTWLSFVFFPGMSIFAIALFGSEICCQSIQKCVCIAPCSVSKCDDDGNFGRYCVFARSGANSQPYPYQRALADPVRIMS